MDLAPFEERLARERRARMAAEQMLEQKQAELFTANKKLSLHARALSSEVMTKSREVVQLQDQTSQARTELIRANEAIHLAEERLGEALETVQDGFALYDSEHRLITANSAFLRIFEGIEEVCIGATYGTLVDVALEEGIVDIGEKDPRDWFSEMLERWEKDPIPPLTLALSSGHYAKLIDRHTRDGGVVSLIIDTTEMMRMWAAVEAIPDGFVLYDNRDRLVICNERYRQIYPKAAAAMVPGASFERILRLAVENGQFREATGREEEWIAERLAAHLEMGQEIEQHLDDGRWLRIYERETPDGGRAGLRIDITDMKRQQEAIEAARSDAEAANRAKSAFLANMSHEIRTPMNGVIGMAELLGDTPLGDEQRLYVDTIRNSGEALLTIINDVLDYSKIEAGKMEIVTAPFDLERTVYEVAMLLQGAAQNKGLELLIDYDMFLPTHFVGDMGRIQQVLTNLAGNAVKFTESGFVLLRVVGLADEASGHQQLHITVEDTGIGIPEDQHERIFGEFNQVENERNRRFDGTGLGLAITRRLVHLMGGETWVDSEPGNGSCFGFRLVLPIAGEQSAEPFGRPGALHHALVVDDMAVNRMILEKQLTQLGLKVTLCSSAQEARTRLAAPAAHPVDVIVTDQNMPGEDGLTMAAKMRKAGVECPILMLSSTPGLAREQAAPEVVTAVLQKPALRADIFAALNSLGRREAGGAPPTPRAEISPESPPPEGAPLRVLVAEDNRTNRLVLSKMLKNLSLDLVFAANGVEAVQKFGEIRPELVFMDVSMPEMDGMEATRRIREIEASTGQRRTPIVALTAHALSGDRERILASGMDDYLTKPLKKAALSAIIADVSARRVGDGGGKTDSARKPVSHAQNPDLQPTPVGEG